MEVYGHGMPCPRRGKPCEHGSLRGRSVQTRSRDCQEAGPAGGSPRESGAKGSKGKTRITIRLDDDVLEWFREQAQRAAGGSYQNLFNDAQPEHIRRADEPLEKTLRLVVREELRLVG